jgi:hypothetical protein
MSCFNPSYVECRKDDYTGALSWTFKGPARFQDPKQFGSYEDLEDRGWFRVIVPCRHCLGCQLDYARSWSVRMMIELDQMKKGIFLTLTYRNSDLPLTDSGFPTLKKSDWQLFMKRLRERFNDRKLRFFMAGEYGSKRGRPHMHAIIFGLSLDDFPDLRCIDHNEIGNPYFTSKLMEDIWSHGFVLLGTVNHDSCNYVARYVLKKHYKKDLVHLHGAIPEFVLMSRRPGIGLNNYEQYLTGDKDFLTFRSLDEVHTVPIPKQIVKKGRKSDFFIDFCNSKLYNRFKQSSERLRSELEFFGISYSDYLSRSYKSFKESAKLLPERK